MSRHKSCLCRCSSMFVINFLFHGSPQRPLPIFFSGRDHDYQTLNSNFAVNVIKYAMIISWFPNPLKPRVFSYICITLSLNPALVSFHACYRTFPPRFDKKLNSSDPWLRNGLRRWRSTGRTGMINRFVTPLHRCLVRRLVYRTICSCG
jgi:hypothetical protein